MSDIFGLLFAVVAIGVLLGLLCDLRRIDREYAEACAELEFQRRSFEAFARRVLEGEA